KAHLNLDKSVLVPDDTEKLQTVDNKVDQVKKMKGAEFDKSFGQVMANAHKDVIALLHDNRDVITSPDLKAFVDATIPKLDQHRDIGDRIARGQRAAMLNKGVQGRTPDEDRKMMRESIPSTPVLP